MIIVLYVIAIVFALSIRSRTMSNTLLNPAAHPDWVRPHSIEWYAQLGKLTGQYSFDWKSTVTEPNGESMFTHEVSRMVPGKKVLDIGCGHGEFALQWSTVAKHIVGIDITSDFIKQGNQAGRQHVTFITANTKDRLPFEDGEFDCAYNRRGPTSAYLDVKRVSKRGGKLIGLHPAILPHRSYRNYFLIFSSLPLRVLPYSIISRKDCKQADSKMPRLKR